MGRMTSGLSMEQFLSEKEDKMNIMIEMDYLAGMSLMELKEKYGIEKVREFFMGREGKLLSLAVKKRAHMKLLKQIGSIASAVEYVSFLACLKAPLLVSDCPHFKELRIRHTERIEKLKLQIWGRDFFYEVVLPVWELYYEEIKRGVIKRLECSKKKLSIFKELKNWGEAGERLIKELAREYMPHHHASEVKWKAVGVID